MDIFSLYKTVKFKKLSSMIDLDKHRVYLLSGTPVPNGWEGIWSQIYLLDKGKRLGKSYWKFLDEFFTIYGYKKYLTKPNKKFLLITIIYFNLSLVEFCFMVFTWVVFFILFQLECLQVSQH